jgi:hypothetical protein
MGLSVSALVSRWQAGLGCRSWKKGDIEWHQGFSCGTQFWVQNFSHPTNQHGSEEPQSWHILIHDPGPTQVVNIFFLAISRCICLTLSILKQPNSPAIFTESSPVIHGSARSAESSSTRTSGLRSQVVSDPNVGLFIPNLIDERDNVWQLIMNMSS